MFHVRGLSPATLGVHRAAVSSFLAPADSLLSESPLLRRFMWAAVLECPLARSLPRFSWDVAEVLNFLCGWGDLPELSFCQLSHRCFALILLFSCGRISDLACL